MTKFIERGEIECSTLVALDEMVSLLAAPRVGSYELSVVKRNLEKIVLGLIEAANNFFFGIIQLQIAVFIPPSRASATPI